MATQDCVGQLIERLKTDNGGVLRGGHAEVFLARAPGRIDLMGGISEYAGGLACLMPAEAGAAVALQRRDDRKLVLKNYNVAGAGGTVTLALDDFYGTAGLLPLETLRQIFAGDNQWAAHIAGAYPTLGKHKKLTRRTHGANIACFLDLPTGKGADGAGAALACATLWAMTAAYHLILEPLEVAVLAQKVENQIAGTLAGISEPAAAVLGKQGQMLLLKCQPHEVKGYVQMPTGLMAAGLQFGVNGGSGEFRAMRVAAFMAQAIISRLYADTGAPKDPTRGYLANVTPEAFARYFQPMLPETITGEQFLKEHSTIADRLTTIDPRATYRLRAAAAFHVGENARTTAFVEQLRAISGPMNAEERRARAMAAGKLMYASHEAAKAEAGLTDAAADALVQQVQQRGIECGLYGARLSGSAGGGVTVLAEADAGAELEAIASQCRAQTGRDLILLTGSSNGSAETEPQHIAATAVGGTE